MIFKVAVHANANQLTISVPQAGLSENLPNVIALDQNNKICAIGETEDEMKLSEDFEKWRKKHKIRFVNPFEFDKYGTSYAIVTLDFYVRKAFRKIGRDLMIGRLLDCCDYDLWLWNYDYLPTEARDEFKYLLKKKHFLKIRHISINGSSAPQPSAEFLQKKKAETRRRKIAEFTLKLFFIFWMSLLFIGLYWLIPPSILSGSISFDRYGLSVLIVFVVLSATIVYVSIFLGAISWMYVMRRYLPVELIRSFLPSLGISKLLINWFADKILGEATPILYKS